MKYIVQDIMVIASDQLSGVTKALLCDYYADFIPLKECQSGKIFFANTLVKILNDFDEKETTMIQTDISYSEVSNILSIMKVKKIEMVFIQKI